MFDEEKGEGRMAKRDADDEILQLKRRAGSGKQKQGRGDALLCETPMTKNEKGMTKSETHMTKGGYESEKLITKT